MLCYNTGTANDPMGVTAMIDLLQLERFLLAVKLSSITRAAAALHITQPTLSKSITSLEEQLGAPLLLRDNRGIRLTPAGAFLYEHGQKLMSLAGSVEQGVQNISAHENGSFSICSETFRSETTFELLHLFSLQNRETRLDLQIIDSDELLALVASMEFDMGLIHYTADLAEQLREDYGLVHLFQEQLSVVMSVDNPLAGAGELTPEMLRGQNVLFPLHRSSLQPIFQRLADALGLAYEAVPKADADGMLFNTRVNQAVSFTNSDMTIYPEDCVLIPLADIDTGFGVGLVWNRMNGKPAIRKMLQIAAGHFPDYKRLF